MIINRKIVGGGGSTETLDEYGLPPKDTGFDWHNNNALYLVFDNKAEPNTNANAQYGFGKMIDYNPSNITVTVGIMEGSVYVPKKTIEKVGGFYPNGQMSEFSERWVIVRIVGDITTFYGSTSPCFVAVYGRMTTLTNYIRITQNNAQYSVKSWEIEGTVGGTAQGFNLLYSLRRFSMHFAGNIVNFANLFSNSPLLNSVTITVPSSNAITVMGYFFNGCRFLESLDLQNWNVASVTSANINGIFNNCVNLKTLNLDGWDLAGVTSKPEYFFTNLDSLTNFTAPVFHCSVIFSNATSLTHTSLMSIINNLATVSTSQTLTLGSTNLAKLTAEEIAIATDKGWTVA